MFIRLRRTRLPRRTLRCRPRIPGRRHSEGRINLPSFSPPPSEGYILSPASSPILLADLSLLQGFSLLYSQFPCSMFSRATSFLGAYSICMHHPSMFCVCTPPTLLFLLHFLLAYFSFLFLCAPLCAVYLEGYSFVATSFLQDLRFPTDLATSCVKIGAIDL